MYLPFARQILETLSAWPLVLVMDGSQVGRGCMVLMVGVLYQKRALPLCWIVYKGKKGHTTAQRHIEALAKASYGTENDKRLSIYAGGKAMPSA